METMEFVRGDQANHTFAIPTASWSSGGTLFFAAKQTIDDDLLDVAALIQGSWTDSVVTDVVIDGIAYKQYACKFLPSATSSIVSSGASSLELLGEFQFVSASSIPTTFPATDEKIPVVVYMDVKRKITV